MTVDDQGAGEEVTAKGRGPRRHDFMGNLSVMALILSVMALIAWLCIGAVGLWVHMGAYAGEMGSDMFSTTRSWAKATLDALSAAFVTYGWVTSWVSVALLSIFMVLQPAAAYSVAGIGHRAHAPAIYSAMHLRARAKLDPAVWAPVESAYGGEHNSSKSAKWAWGEVRGYASDIMLQIAGRVPLGTAVSQREVVLHAGRLWHGEWQILRGLMLLKDNCQGQAFAQKCASSHNSSSCFRAEWDQDNRPAGRFALAGD